MERDEGGGRGRARRRASWTCSELRVLLERPVPAEEEFLAQLGVLPREGACFVSSAWGKGTSPGRVCRGMGEGNPSSSGGGRVRVTHQVTPLPFSRSSLPCFPSLYLNRFACRQGRADRQGGKTQQC